MKSLILIKSYLNVDVDDDDDGAMMMIGVMVMIGAMMMIGGDDEPFCNIPVSF